MRIRHLISAVCDLLLALLFVYLLITPEATSASTAKALSFCANSLLPALFVYTVLAQIIVSMPITALISKRLGLGGLIFVLGLLCGYPIGAKLAISLYKNGKIDKKYAEYLTSFSNNASLSFVVGFVGRGLFKRTSFGIRLFIIQAASALIGGLIMRFLLYKNGKIPKISATISRKSSLRETLADTAQNMLNICACVVFFVVVGESISSLFALNPFLSACLKSVLEFSSGALAAAALPKYAFQLTAFAISFGGVSVLMQVKSLVDSSLSLKPYALGKLIACTVMLVLSFFG